MININIDEHLISIIENLYKKAGSAVIVNDAREDVFRISVGVRLLPVANFIQYFLGQNYARHSKQPHLSEFNYSCRRI